MNDKIKKFIEDNPNIETPYVVCDTDIVKENYKEMKKYFPYAEIFTAIKANPAKENIRVLSEEGSSFDIASIGELDDVLEYCTPDRVSFGNTIKKEKHIKYAYEKGVRLFVFDSIEDLEKIARSAPNSQVFCRILWTSTTSEWTLSEKFGCDPKMAIDLLIKAKELGLDPIGVSFHVGSQQHDIGQWWEAFNIVSDIFKEVKEKSGIELSMINTGGGIPIQYTNPVADLNDISEMFESALIEFFGEKEKWPRIIMEPGRSITKDAGIMVTEIINIAKKDYTDNGKYHVFLDVGVFNGGLVESCSILYNIYPLTETMNDHLINCVLYGPTCDSYDKFADKGYTLPANLRIGDKLVIENQGCYNSSYASVNFNGIPPIKQYSI